MKDVSRELILDGVQVVMLLMSLTRIGRCCAYCSTGPPYITSACYTMS